MNIKLAFGLLAVIAVVPAHAEMTEKPTGFDSFSTNGSVTFLTDYYSRGYSQTQGNPAVQGFLRVDHNSGLYAQLFASNIQLDIGSSLEWDYYLGYDYFFNDQFKLNIQYLDVNYPGADKAIPDADYEEYSVAAIGMGLFKEADELNFSLYYSPEYTFQTGKMLRYETSYRYPIAENWNAYAQAGYNQFSSKDAYDVLWATDQKDSFYDYKLGANYSYHDFIFDLSYVDSNINHALSNADDAVIFSLTKAF